MTATARDDETGAVLAGLTSDLLADLAELYKDLHTHPELSFAEERTAGVVTDQLTDLGWEVHIPLGRTGVAGVLRNGPGPTILLRADMDALPVAENTDLPYASETDGVMHACGHDMHVTCLLGALRLLASSTDRWSGTIVAVFQPAEETGFGAEAMIDDGLYDMVPEPSIVLAQHVMPFPAGQVGYRAGDFAAATDAIEVTLFGRGGHGAMPERTVDPIIMAASIVMRLQTVVSREIAATDIAVVTVGALVAGTKDNVIPDTATLKLNIRTYSPEVRQVVLGAVKRIIVAESSASGAPKEPLFDVINTFPVLHNDPDATTATVTALRSVLGDARVVEIERQAASEDAGRLASAIGVPIVYWAFGGIDPDVYAEAARKGTLTEDIPANHNPGFAPVLEPTLKTGIQAMTAAALHWLATE